MITLSQSLQEYGLTDTETGSLSLDYGKRLLVNAAHVDIKKLTHQDIVEIVDYDPLKNIMMVIGLNDPMGETPVHWIIQKARHDVNAVLQINSSSIFEKFQTILPVTDNETQPGTLERAKKILHTLQKAKTILIKNEGIIFVGMTAKEIQSSLRNCLGGLK